jgi:DNA-directed RNA polymerase subunit RPC12/RpoP
MNLMWSVVAKGLLNGWKNFSEFSNKENFEPLIQIGFLDEFVYHNVKTEEAKEQLREDFVKQAFYYCDIIGQHTFLYNDLKLKPPHWQFIEGNDGDLKYWYKCKDCGSIIVLDHGDEHSFDRPMVCSHCNPDIEKKTTHQFYETGSQMWTDLQPWVNHQLMYNNNIFYKIYIDILFKIRDLTWPIRKIFIERKAKNV